MRSAFPEREGAFFVSISMAENWKRAFFGMRATVMWKQLGTMPNKVKNVHRGGEKWLAGGFMPYMVLLFGGNRGKYKRKLVDF
jgi:hypothetical protein